ncbi:MAG: hypothetical protein PWP23_3248 [Candidatus Sumerlaeota bacterium]|nr:hypothetical protein [Candidatus Sumerlaeota bacterium]
MGETLLAPKKERLLSLDVFRGVTIAMMVLVNNPGTWSYLYHPVEHAPWDGFTPTDFIFPFFLFIVGVAMTFSFDRRLREGASKARLLEQVVRRTVILFLLGLILQGFPNFRLIGPYILVIVGLGLLFAHEPPFGFSQSSKAATFKALGLGVLAVAAGWWILDFGHFNGTVVGYDPHKFLWPMTNDAGGRVLRVPGVLQRIALCYFFASLIMMATRTTAGRVAWVAVLLGAYWVICQHDFVARWAGHELGALGGRRDAPMGVPFPGLLHDWIDTKLLGAHLYGARPDPEGLLSTIPAIGTTLCGILCGTWLHRSDLTKEQKCLGLFYSAGWLIAAGLFWGYAFPINKKIWTSSYVLAMAGFAQVFLGMCMYLLDIRGKKAWATPFVVFGTNAIYVFFASGILARCMYMITWAKESGEGSWNVKSWIWENAFQNPVLAGFDHIGFTFSDAAQMKFASLLYAVCYIVVWLGLTYPLYRKKIFLKI